MNRIFPGDPRNAEPIDANFQEILGILGALTDANFATNANLNGAKIAQNSMPGDRIASGTIALAQMGVASVGTTQLVDLGVTKGKLATTVGSRATRTQLEMNSFTGNAGFSIGGANLGHVFHAYLATQLVLSINSWVVVVEQTYHVTASGLFGGIATAVVAPGTAIPVASTTVLGIKLRNPVFTPGGGSVTVEMEYINNT